MEPTTFRQWIETNPDGLPRIADRAGIHRATLWKVLQGQIRPSWETCVKLSAITGGCFAPEAIIREFRAETGDAA